MAPTARVAAVQAEPVWFDMAATVDKTIGLIRQAAEQGADLVAFPETWIPGYPIFLWTHAAPMQMPFIARYHENSMTISGPELTAVRSAARKHKIIVSLGLSERAAGSLYIAQTLIGADGNVLHHRRKLKPTHVERTLFGESDGSGMKVVDTPVGRVGGLCCWEHLQPLTKYAMYAQNEEIHVAAWPCFGILKQVPALSEAGNMAVTRTYAMEGGSFVIASTQIISPGSVALFSDHTGTPSPFVQGGGGFARVYAPDGSPMTEPLEESTEGLVLADIDRSAIALAKNAADPAGHYARPDVTRLVFDNRRQHAVITPGEAADSSVLFPPLDDDERLEAESA